MRAGRSRSRCGSTIYVGGVAALWVCLARARRARRRCGALGKDMTDCNRVKTAMGETGLRLVIAIVTVSFISALLTCRRPQSPAVCLRP